MALIMTEVRCPVGPRELLMKVRMDPEAPPPYSNEDNAMCLHCSFCTRMARRQDPKVLRVVHQYNFIGELIDSAVEYR